MLGLIDAKEAAALAGMSVRKFRLCIEEFQLEAKVFRGEKNRRHLYPREVVEFVKQNWVRQRRKREAK